MSEIILIEKLELGSSYIDADGNRVDIIHDEYAVDDQTTCCVGRVTYFVNGTKYYRIRYYENTGVNIYDTKYNIVGKLVDENKEVVMSEIRLPEKLELGSYIDADGYRVDIVCTDFVAPDLDPCCLGIVTYPHPGPRFNRVRYYNHFGVVRDYPRYNIVGPWREPVKLSGWINVYPQHDNGYYKIYKSAADANEGRISGRIACVYISGTEGVDPDE